MKITALAKLAKMSSTIFLADSGEGRQWVSIDGASYPMDGLPKMNEMELLAVLGVPEEDRPLYTVQRCMAPQCMTEDNLEDDAKAELLNITVNANGHEVRPLYTTYGMICIDDDQRKPVGDSKKTYEFYARKTGELINIVIKNGFKLIAVLPPRKLWAEDNVCGWLDDLTAQAGKLNKEIHLANPDDARYTGAYC